MPPSSTGFREKEAADLIVAIGTTMEADLRAATEIREKEAADFAAEEEELAAVVNRLQRAIAVLENWVVLL